LREQQSRQHRGHDQPLIRTDKRKWNARHDIRPFPSNYVRFMMSLL
jgi:hypothetical protein